MSTPATAAGTAAHMPPLLWAQRRQYVYITVPLQDTTNVTIELKDDGAVLALACDDAEQTHYACALRLYAPVAAEESRHVVRPRQIEIKLKKKSLTKQPQSQPSGDGGDTHDTTAHQQHKDDNDDDDDGEAMWPRLTRDKVKHPQIQIDWHKWRDDDDDDEGGKNDSMLDNFGLHTGNDDDDSDVDRDGDGMQSDLLTQYMQQRARRDAAEHADEDAQNAHGSGQLSSSQPHHHEAQHHNHDALHKEQRQRAADGVDNDDDMPPLEEDEDN